MLPSNKISATVAALLSFSVALMLCSASSVAAQMSSPVYTVQSITVQYTEWHRDHPSLAELAPVPVRLARHGNHLVSAIDGAPAMTVHVPGELPVALPLDASALRAIAAAIVQALNAQGIVGVVVQPHPQDIEAGTGKDLRDPAARSLRLQVGTRQVGEVRAIAVSTGPGSPASRERWILAHSPLQAPGARGRATSLLRIGVLEEYIARLNRHPGRRVQAALTPAPSGGVSVDYRIAEQRPWTAYLQLGDTGTRRTSTHRQTLGFTHNQLTGRDDILQLRYVTNGADGIHAGALSYEAPWRESESVRWKLAASASSFRLAFDGPAGAGRSLRFDASGETWDIGGEVQRTLWQRGSLFVDGSLGLRFQRIHAQSDLGPDARDSFLLPSVSVRVEQRGQQTQLALVAELESNLADLAGTDVRSSDARGVRDQAGGLGRTDPDAGWTVLRWDASVSSTLRALLRDPLGLSPDAAMRASAHELSLRLYGQHAFGSRLIPHAEAIAGGLHTVRGYEQAVAAGDSLYAFSVEARVHVPRLLPPRAPVKIPGFGAVRLAPERDGARPAWDLIVRSFVDGAKVRVHDAFRFESDQELLSVGAGVELQLRSHVCVRLDAGWPLRSGTPAAGGTPPAERGRPRLHFAITTLY